MRLRGFAIGTALRIALYCSLGTLFVSGVVWIVAKLFWSVETDFGSLPSPFESWSMQVHGAAQPIFLVVLGWLFPTHIVRAFKARKNRASGIVIFSSVLMLIVTGYLLYYCGHEAARKVSSFSHSIIGVLIVFVLVGHIVLGRKLMRNRTTHLVQEKV